MGGMKPLCSSVIVGRRQAFRPKSQSSKLVATCLAQAMRFEPTMIMVGREQVRGAALGQI